jgi:2-oxoglutarate ferredoxin oxidoreductase subunit alpha
MLKIGNLKERKSVLKPDYYFFTGNEAAAEGALAAGCNYYAGYPITPSSELMERMSYRLQETGGKFIQMEDEIGSICSMVGAVWAGAKALTATAGPGFSLMQEGLGYAAETETPLVIVDVQRAGPATGQASRVGAGDIMQAKWGSNGDYQIIALCPWSVQEMYDQTVTAFNLAERYRVPVIVLADATVAHLQEKVKVNETVGVFERMYQPNTQPYGHEMKGGYSLPSVGKGEHLLILGTTHSDWGVKKADDGDMQQRVTDRLYSKIMDHIDDLTDYELYHMDDAETVVVSYGIIARSSLYAVNRMREEGHKVGMVRLKVMWPFAGKLMKEIGAKAKTILVPEMNKGQVAGEIMKYARCEVVSHSQTNGEIISPTEIIKQLRRIS